MHGLGHRMAAVCSSYPAIYSSPERKHLSAGDMAGARHGGREHWQGCAATECVHRVLVQPALAKDNSDFLKFFSGTVGTQSLNFTVCYTLLPSHLLCCLLLLSLMPAFFFSLLLWLPLILSNNLSFKVKLSYATGFIFINCIGLTLSLPLSWYF